MTTDPITFSLGDANVPGGAMVPTARELQAIGVIGLDIGRSRRVTLMNQIGAALKIPPGGWHGQAKLFDGNDIRLGGLLTRLANEHQAKHVADNLSRAGRYVDVNMMLALVSAAREFDRSLTATGTALIETYHSGGLDFLWEEKKKLGLPHSVTKPWQEVPRFINRESGRFVHPAKIPAHDQLMAYAAQIAASFAHQFKNSLRAEFGPQAVTAFSRASRASLLVWQAFSFLAPGGILMIPSGRCATNSVSTLVTAPRLACTRTRRARREGHPPSMTSSRTPALNASSGFAVRRLARPKRSFWSRS